MQSGYKRTEHCKEAEDHVSPPAESCMNNLKEAQRQRHHCEEVDFTKGQNIAKRSQKDRTLRSGYKRTEHCKEVEDHVSPRAKPCVDDPKEAQQKKKKTTTLL